MGAYRRTGRRRSGRADLGLGPGPITDVLTEESGKVSGGSTSVQYFDKARMELPDPDADPVSADSVRAGAILNELITGRVLFGDGEESQETPSIATVVGDPDDPNGLTYQIIGTLIDLAPFGEGETLTTRVTPEGELTVDESLGLHSITAEHYVSEMEHRVASVFWDFLNSTGVVWSGDDYVEGPLFPDPLGPTGMPLTEAYWVNVSVGGLKQDVLVQCFERRCLSFTPGNPEGWQVESNNVGFHYYDWRYNQLDVDQPPAPTEEPESELPVAAFESATGETHTMRLEVAATDSTRACGLMHRLELPEDTGMLFVWEGDQGGSFWNCNTFVPLTLAWIDADRVIIDFTQMEAQTPGESQNVISYQSPGPFRYVVEANQGWFAERGIVAGSQVDLDEPIEHGDTGSDALCQQLGMDCN